MRFLDSNSSLHENVWPVLHSRSLTNLLRIQSIFHHSKYISKIMKFKFKK